MAGQHGAIKDGPPARAGDPDRSLTDLYTSAEVAALLKVNVKTVKAMLADGRLERVVLGPHTIRVTAASVRLLIASSTTRST